MSTTNMNSTKQSYQFDSSNNSKKEIKRKRSFYFWNNNNKTIDNKNLSENGPRSTNQVDNKNNESTCLNDESTTATSKNSFLSKLFKRMNSVLSKSPSSAGQRSENKVKTDAKIKHHRSMADMQTNYFSQVTNNNRKNTRFSMNNFDHIIALPSPPQTINESTSELEDWKTALLNELDATRYKISKKSVANTTDYNLDRINDNSGSNEVVINALQPSGMENNRTANKQSLAAINEKLGVIPKRIMIDDWLHYNSILDSASTSTTTNKSYLQHNYNESALYNKKQLTSNQQEIEGSSLLSKELKKQGKMKYRDHIKEKLDIAAARRNEIKANRQREQMDTALFETMHMLRENNDDNNSHNILQQQQNIEKLFNDNKKKGNKAYISDASSSVVSNDYYLSSSINHCIKEEDKPVW